MAPTYGKRWPVYARQWDAMQRTRLTETRKAAQRLLASKERYQTVEAKTGVPWWLIAVLHERESGADFSTQLAQGDPLDKVSTHVPKGQGPYFGPDAWERAALIALETDGLNKVKDWRLEKALFFAEKFNGFGYANHGVVSPYLWAGSDQYKSGKFISDGAYSSTAVDKQLGVAPLIKTLAELDPTIELVRETRDDQPPPPAPKPVLPLITITVNPPGSARVVVVGSAE